MTSLPHGTGNANSIKKNTQPNVEVNVTWPVELLPSRHIEHFAVDSHEDPGVLQTVVRLQLCNGEIPLLHFGQRLFRRWNIGWPVAAEDFVDEEEAEAEQSQIERRCKDLLQDPTRSWFGSLRFNHVDFSLASALVRASACVLGGTSKGSQTPIQSQMRPMGSLARTNLHDQMQTSRRSKKTIEIKAKPNEPAKHPLQYYYPLIFSNII